MIISKELKRRILDRAVLAVGVRVDETLLQLEAVCLNLDMTVTNEDGIYIKLLEKIINSGKSTNNSAGADSITKDKNENDLIFI